VKLTPTLTFEKIDDTRSVLKDEETGAEITIPAQALDLLEAGAVLFREPEPPISAMVSVQTSDGQDIKICNVCGGDKARPIRTDIWCHAHPWDM
jgi:hypothetical protein